VPFLPLDGPSLQTTLSVNTTTVQEVKVGASAITERKVVTIMPTSGKIYVYFGGDAGVPSAATVIAHGLIQYKNAMCSYEASDSQPIYILSLTGTTTVKIVERA
jgi:hypothetical protein